VGRTDVSYRWGRTTLTALAARNVRFSAYESTPWYEEILRELRAVRWLNRSLGLEAGGSYGTLTFAGSERTTT